MYYQAVSMKKLILCVLILITLVGHGCIYIPIIYTKSPTGSVDPSFITIGVTTKEDVILKCGNPFGVRDGVVLDDEKMITYRWDTAEGMLFVSLGGRSGGAGSIESTSVLRIEFDENDFVKSYKLDRDRSLRQWL
jgi:hypothetical protein